MKIKEQTSDGEVLFNIDGRPAALDDAQAERDDRSSVGGQPIQQKIDQKIDVTVTPAARRSRRAKNRSRAARKPRRLKGRTSTSVRD